MQVSDLDEGIRLPLPVEEKPRKQSRIEPVSFVRPWRLFFSSRRVALLLLLCVAAEFAVLTLVFDLSDWAINKGDEPGYRVLAINILDHGTFSLDEKAPFEPSVFRAPGYPLFVAFAYSLSGRSATFLRLVQFGLLGLTGFLLYILATPQFGPNISALAGILCVAYPPFVFQAAYHLTETLATFLMVLLFWLTVALARGTPHPRIVAFGAGLTAAYSALVRPSLAILVLCPIALLLWSMMKGADRKKNAALIGLVAVGYLFLIIPCAARNANVARAFVPFGSAAGWSFYVSMSQYAGNISYRLAPGEWSEVIREYDNRRTFARETLSGAPIPEGASATALSDVLVDKGYSRDGLNRLRSLPLRSLIAGIPIRLLFLWSTADTSPWAAGGLFHRMLQLLHVTFVVLILSGFYLMRRELARLWPLLIIPVYLTLIHLVFHVEPRYSFPGRPFLLVFAAVAVVRLAVFARSSLRSDRNREA